MANEEADNPATGQPSPAPVAQEPEIDTEDDLEPTPEEEAAKQSEEDIAAAKLIEDEFEELEYNGKKHKVSKELRPLLLFQEDYTRKTMSLAEERKALAAERDIERQFTREVGSLTLMDEQIAQFESVNWQELGEKDPVQAQNLRFQMEDLEKARNKLAYNIDQEARRRTAEAERHTANARSQDFASLSKADPEVGWQGQYTQVLRDKLDPFARKFGYTGEQLSQVSSRDIKVLNLAMIGYDLLQKQKQASAKPVTPAVPVPTLGKSKSVLPTGLDDRLPSEEWYRRRDAQVRRRG